MLGKLGKIENKIVENRKKTIIALVFHNNYCAKYLDFIFTFQLDLFNIYNVYDYNISFIL